MTIDQIDWSKLKPYKKDSRESFEQLCYQIAKASYSNRGDFTPIDDSGGGSGIEFFLELPNGDIWGWQAKYYPGSSQRLTANRRQKISESLRVSRREYRNRLKRWYLCTPLDLAPKGKNSELKWFKNELPLIGGDTKLIHWGDSELANRLRRPTLNGIFQFFFGEFQPRPEWFRRQVENELANIADKYIPQLHTSTSIDFQIHTLIVDPEFVVGAKKRLHELNKALVELDLTARRIKATEDREFATLLSQTAQTLQDFCAGLKNAIGTFVEFLRDPLRPGHEKISATFLDQTSRLHGLWESVTKCWLPINQAEGQFMERSDEEKEKRRFRNLRSLHSSMWGLLDGPIPAMLYWFESHASIFERRVLHLIGGAGTGKTHVLAQLCSSHHASALFLRGISFSRSGTIQSQILQQLDLKVQWSAFLAALGAYSSSYGKRILICIDALNESEDAGLWRSQLRGFERELMSYPGITLVTSSRASYKGAIWGEAEARSVPYLEVSGFNSAETKQAVRRYFDYFRISAVVSLAALEAFKHPLYLMIFCQATNRDRQQIKQVFLGEQGLFDVFERYLDQANISFSKRVDRPVGGKFLHVLLRSFAKKLWDKVDRGISSSEARILFDGTGQGAWSSSVTKALLDEDLILTRSYRDDSERYEFTYDLLAGYLISEQAIATLPGEFAGSSDEQAAEAIGKILRPLTDKNFLARHPLHEDILRAVAATLPARRQRHLLYIAEDNAFSAAVNALFEMDSRYVSTREVRAVRILFELPQNREPLLRKLRNTAFVNNHPLNARLFSELLSRLSMADRDLSWSEHLRLHVDDFRDLIEEFVESLSAPVQGPEHKNHLRLAALFLSWFLTSVNRYLRDAATRALVIFGSRFPKTLFSLVEAAFSCNDPYLPERMLAASYGAVMRLHSRPQAAKFREKLLPLFAYSIYAAMFSEHARHATTHSLTRDYAASIIGLALVYAPSLLTDAEKRRCRPPFSAGPRRWRRRPDSDEGRYRDGNSPLGFDWENKTMGRLAVGRREYDYEDPRFIEVKEKILWRIHDLGYSLDKFGEIDKQIAGFYGRSLSATQIMQRYGEKYSWIAFYELYGILDDDGLLRQRPYWDPSPHPDEADIDPSFPGPPHKTRVFDFDILGHTQKDSRKWVRSGPTPGISDYLRVDVVGGKNGPWFLLDGTILQRDDKVLRNGFVFVQALYVADADFDEFCALIGSRSPGHWFRDFPNAEGFFAGEFPWRRDFPTSVTDAFKVQIGKRKVKNPPPPPAIRVDFGDGHKILHLQPPDLPEWRFEPIERSLYVEVATQDVQFQERSPLVDRPRGSVPARQMAEQFGLWVGLPSWDLFDPSGTRVSITSQFGDKGWTTYAACSVVESYLSNHRLKLLWIIYSERQMLTTSGSDAGYQQYRELYMWNGKLKRLQSGKT